MYTNVVSMLAASLSMGYYVSYLVDLECFVLLLSSVPLDCTFLSSLQWDYLCSEKQDLKKTSNLDFLSV